MEMQVNQAGQEIAEEQLFTWRDDPETTSEQSQAIKLLLDHLGLEIWRTNATKHGGMELVLREKDKGEA